MFKKLIYLIICLILLSACTKSDNKVNNEVKQEEDKKEQDKQEKDNHKAEINSNDLIDDINNNKVNVQLRGKFYDARKVFIRDDTYGFSIRSIYKQDNGEYLIKIYNSVFLSPKGLVTIYQYSPSKKYEEKDYSLLNKPDIEISNIKEEYVNEYINDYKKDGFIELEI